MIDKAAEYAKDLLEAVREKHAEAKQMVEESERLRLQGQGGGPQQGYGRPPGGPQYSQPIHYPGHQQQDTQSPYNYQVRVVLSPSSSIQSCSYGEAVLTLCT